MASPSCGIPSVRIGDRVRKHSNSAEGYVVDVVVKISFPDGLQTCNIKDLEQSQHQFGAPVKKRKIYKCVHQFELEDDADPTVETLVNTFETIQDVDNHFMNLMGAGGEEFHDVRVCLEKGENWEQISSRSFNTSVDIKEVSYFLPHCIGSPQDYLILQDNLQNTRVIALKRIDGSVDGMLLSGVRILRVPDNCFGKHVLVARQQLADALSTRLQDITIYKKTRLMADDESVSDLDELVVKHTETPATYLVKKVSGAVGPGLYYRKSKLLSDRICDTAFVRWGETVRGLDHGDGWIECIVRS